MWTDYVVIIYCERNCKVNMEQKHAACVERCLYDIYTEIPCLEMSGSNDMAVLNQVCFSDFLCREACQCDSKQDVISGKEW